MVTDAEAGVVGIAVCYTNVMDLVGLTVALTWRGAG